MAIGSESLEILSCPICSPPVRLSMAGDYLMCVNCHRRYPIRNDNSFMMMDNTETERRAGPFSATYFPWSVISDEQVLKRALLYFEKVLLIGPTQDDFYRLAEEYADDKYSGIPGSNRAIVDFYDQIQPLLQSGVVEIVNADSVTTDPTTVAHLRRATVTDALDPVWNQLFQDLTFASRPLGGGMWYGEASPEGHVSYRYWKSAHLKDICSSIEAEVDQYIDTLPQAAKVFLRRNIRLPDSVIGSLLINSSLACIQQNGSAPLCDTERGMSILQSKYHRIFDRERNPHAEENARAMDNFVADVQTKAGLLATCTLQMLVPNIEARTLSEILELREQFRDNLELFRLKMVTIATKLKRSALDPDFSVECQQFVTTEVLPVLLEMQKQVRLSSGKVLRELSEGVLSLKPTVPFVISALSPLPVWAAALAACGILTLEAALKLYLEREQATYNNGFAYLFNLKGRSIRLDQTLWSRSAALFRSRGV